MEAFWTGLWTVLVFGSIAWYAILVFYIGVLGAKDIKEMIASLTAAQAKSQDDPPASGPS